MTEIGDLIEKIGGRAMETAARAGIRAFIERNHPGWFPRVAADAEDEAIALLLQAPARFMQRVKS